MQKTISCTTYGGMSKERQTLNGYFDENVFYLFATCPSARSRAYNYLEHTNTVVKSKKDVTVAFSSFLKHHFGCYFDVSRSSDTGAYYLVTRIAKMADRTSKYCGQLTRFLSAVVLAICQGHGSCKNTAISSLIQLMYMYISDVRTKEPPKVQPSTTPQQQATKTTNTTTTTTGTTTNQPEGHGPGKTGTRGRVDADSRYGQSLK